MKKIGNERAPAEPRPARTDSKQTLRPAEPRTTAPAQKKRDSRPSRPPQKKSANRPSRPAQRPRAEAQEPTQAPKRYESAYVDREGNPIKGINPNPRYFVLPKDEAPAESVPETPPKREPRKVRVKVKAKKPKDGNKKA